MLLPFFLLNTDVILLFGQSSFQIFRTLFLVHKVFMKGGLKDETRSHAQLSLSNVAFPTVDAAMMLLQLASRLLLQALK